MDHQVRRSIRVHLRPAIPTLVDGIVIASGSIAMLLMRAIARQAQIHTVNP
jgi:hypothetical protein